MGDCWFVPHPFYRLLLVLGQVGPVVLLQQEIRCIYSRSASIVGDFFGFSRNDCDSNNGRMMYSKNGLV